MMPTIVSLAGFFAGAAAIVAGALAVRDLRAARRSACAPVPDTVPAPDKLPLDRSQRVLARLIDEAGGLVTSDVLMSLVVGGAVVGAATGILLAEHFLVAAAGVVVGSVLPLVALIIIRQRRVARMRRDLPDTLQMIADAMHGGYDLQQAAEMVARESAGPLAAEFSDCASRLGLGHSVAAVLERMARRIPLAEFRVFATAALVHRRTGGSLARLTQRMSAAARDRQQFHGHLSAVTAGSRLSAIGLVVGSVIAVGVLFWVDPQYIGTLVDHRLGPRLLMAAAALELTGIVWVWRVMKVAL